MEPTLLLVDDETGIAAAIDRVFTNTVFKLLIKPCSYAAIQSAMNEVFLHHELTLNTQRHTEKITNTISCWKARITGLHEYWFEYNSLHDTYTGIPVRQQAIDRFAKSRGLRWKEEFCWLMTKKM